MFRKFKCHLSCSVKYDDLYLVNICQDVCKAKEIKKENKTK